MVSETGPPVASAGMDEPLALTTAGRPRVKRLIPVNEMDHISGGVKDQIGRTFGRRSFERSARLGRLSRLSTQVDDEELVRGQLVTASAHRPLLVFIIFQFGPSGLFRAVKREGRLEVVKGLGPVIETDILPLPVRHLKVRVHVFRDGMMGLWQEWLLGFD